MNVRKGFPERNWVKSTMQCALLAHFSSLQRQREVVKRNMGEIGPDLVEWMVADDLVSSLVHFKGTNHL